MKLCVDCKWYRNGYCDGPIKGIDPVTGATQKHRWRMASTHRGIPYILALLWGSCSVGGRFWESK